MNYRVDLFGILQVDVESDTDFYEINGLEIEWSKTAKKSIEDDNKLFMIIR